MADQKGLNPHEILYDDGCQKVKVCDSDENPVDLINDISLAAGSNNIGAVELVDPADDTRKIEFDTMFRVPVGITIEHHEIHEGDSYEIHIDSVNTAVAGLNVAFKTASGTKLAHMLFGWSSNDEVQFELIEGATWTQGTGTALAFFNNNRNVGDGGSTVILENKNQATFTASNVVIKDVTGISGGTVFDSQYTYNASVGNKIDAESRAAHHEWNLKNDTTYIVRITKTDANCKISIDLHWYEHTTD